MSSPKVSIGIISYNHAKFLPTAIESALAQTCKDFEIVIVDDGSSDGSLAIAEDYAAKNPQIKVFTHPNRVNRGISATCNLAIENCAGEYVALLASDDAFLPDTIEEQSKFLEARPETGMICGVSQVIDENGARLSQTFGEDIWSETNPLKIMLWSNKVSAPTVMIRRSCYERVGLYAEGIAYNDWEMWLRILLFSDWKIGFVNKTLALYRSHGTNVSLNMSSYVNYTRNLQVLLHLERLMPREAKETDAPKFNLLKEMITSSTLNLFYLCAEEGKVSGAARHLLSYLKRNPKGILKPRRFASVSYRMAQGFTRAVFAAR